MSEKTKWGQETLRGAYKLRNALSILLHEGCDASHKETWDKLAALVPKIEELVKELEPLLKNNPGYLFNPPFDVVGRG